MLAALKQEGVAKEHRGYEHTEILEVLFVTQKWVREVAVLCGERCTSREAQLDAILEIMSPPSVFPPYI